MSRREGARARLRSYFLENVGRVVDSEVLRGIAGISEWARRVRELRDEEGYDIQTHRDRSALRPGEYILVTSIPHPVASRSRASAREGGGVQSAIRVAARDEQLAVLTWLAAKFPNEARRLVDEPKN